MKQKILEILTEYTIQSAFNPIEFYRGYANHANGQALVLVSHIYYDSDLKEILRAGQLLPLKYFARKCSVVIGMSCTNHIEKLVSLGPRSFPSSSTFRSCILLAIYFRDLSLQIVQAYSINSNLLLSTDWVNSFKVEFNREELVVDVSQSMYSVEYGYEYMGGADRLIWNKKLEGCFRAMWV
jgi:hypothetical protein